MRDRFTNGFVAGLIAGIAYLSWSLFSRYVLTLTQFSIAEFGALLTFNRPPQELTTILIAWGGFAALLFAITIGIIFSYLILLIGNERLYLKAILYSWAAWYILIDVLIMHVIKFRLGLAIGTAISASINATIYGTILAFVYNRLHNTLKV